MTGTLVARQAVYCLRPEQQPIFVFCVDVSPRALETGFTAACLAAVEESLDSVPGGERARVGVMTFDKCIHVYRFNEEGEVSQMAVAPDTEVGVWDGLRYMTLRYGTVGSLVGGGRNERWVVILKRQHYSWCCTLWNLLIDRAVVELVTGRL